MNIVIMDVSPQQAQAWLKNNRSNRSVSTSAVCKYAEDMKCGRWELTPQAISINSSGELADGQHRLMAVVRSGVTVKMTVAFGYESTVYDIGRKRSAADLYYFKTGERLHSICLAVPAIWIPIQSNREQNSITIEEKIAFTQEKNESIVSAFKICCVGNTKPMARLAPVVMGVMIAQQCGVSRLDLEMFFRCVNSGFPTDDNRDYSPAICLRNYLLLQKNGSRTSSISYKMAMVCVTCKMIESFINGERRTLARDTFNASYVNKIFPQFRIRAKENGW